jgi:hypothetical protein
VGAHFVESRIGDKDKAGTRPDDRAGTRPAPTSSLGDVVGIFKSISTHQYAINVNANNWPAFPGKLCQRYYYERIVRNDDELNRIREYILNNPQRWDYDAAEFKINIFGQRARCNVPLHISPGYS